MMGRILIVDDRKDHREGIKHGLVKRGYSVLLAASGGAAAGKVKRGLADGVILDMKMPGMDGVQTLEKIRSYDAHVPVIGISAYDMSQYQPRAADLRVFDWIHKPLTERKMGILAKRMGEAIAESRPLGVYAMIAELTKKHHNVGADLVREIANEVLQFVLPYRYERAIASLDSKLISLVIETVGILHQEPEIAKLIQNVLGREIPEVGGVIDKLRRLPLEGRAQAYQRNEQEARVLISRMSKLLE